MILEDVDESPRSLGESSVAEKSDTHLKINIRKKIPPDQDIIALWDQDGQFGQTPSRFNALYKARSDFINTQQAILDIGILFQIYNQVDSGITQFVVVVGNAHLRALSNYFESNGIPLLRGMHSDINTNAVNLRGTFAYRTLDACLRTIDGIGGVFF